MRCAALLSYSVFRDFFVKDITHCARVYLYNAMAPVCAASRLDGRSLLALFLLKFPKKQFNSVLRAKYRKTARVDLLFKSAC